ncbi:MAG: hypothetical protein RL748_4004, partial [Pseudomonadota bacterium]
RNDREIRMAHIRQHQELIAIAKQKQGEVSDEDMLALLKKMEVVDAQNQALLDQLVADCGWPTKDQFGPTAVFAAVMVSIHAQLPYKIKYFPMVEEGFKRGDVAPGEYARLVDKILIRQNKLQKYGTQLSETKMGERAIMPVEDPEHLNDRRQAIGMRLHDDFPMPSNWPSSTPKTPETIGQAKSAIPATK